jgi:hypothetical protein
MKQHATIDYQYQWCFCLCLFSFIRPPSIIAPHLSHVIFLKSVGFQGQGGNQTQQQGGNQSQQQNKSGGPLSKVPVIGETLENINPLK